MQPIIRTQGCPFRVWQCSIGEKISLGAELAQKFPAEHQRIASDGRAVSNLFSAEEFEGLISAGTNNWISQAGRRRLKNKRIRSRIGLQHPCRQGALRLTWNFLDPNVSVYQEDTGVGRVRDR